MDEKALTTKDTKEIKDKPAIPPRQMKVIGPADGLDRAAESSVNRRQTRSMGAVKTVNA